MSQEIDQNNFYGEYEEDTYEGKPRGEEDDELDADLEFGALDADEADDSDEDEEELHELEDLDEDEDLKASRGPAKSSPKQVSMADLEDEERSLHDDDADDSEEETVTRTAKGSASPFDEEITWTRKKGRTILVGVTETALLSVGSVESIDFPGAGDEIGEDDVLLEIHGDEGDLVVTSPVSGRVLELNPILVEEPQLLSDDPLDEGWLLRIFPEE